jgi:hypothetical protein
MREIENLIVEMAQSSPGWVGFESKVLNHLGHAVSRTTIANILGDTALNQPQRQRRQASSSLNRIGRS